MSELERKTVETAYADCMFFENPKGQLYIFNEENGKRVSGLTGDLLELSDEYEEVRNYLAENGLYKRSSYLENYFYLAYQRGRDYLLELEKANAELIHACMEDKKRRNGIKQKAEELICDLIQMDDVDPDFVGSIKQLFYDSGLVCDSSAYDFYDD